MIFGIGLPRTGTRSLKQACRILGFSGVSGLGLLRRDFYQGNLKLPLQCKVVVGGISYYYEALDKLYPDSKFILTTRSEGAWLKSVNNLWGVTWTPAESQVRLPGMWQHMGNCAYDFDVLRAIRRSHLLGALDYFVHRPGGLLVLDMEKPQWPQLCGFLDRPCPDVTYPHEGKWRDEGQTDPVERFGLVRAGWMDGSQGTGHLHGSS